MREVVMLQEGDVFTSKTLGGGKLVVELAAMSGGGFGHGPLDIYPDGWGVSARRLTEDGAYDPDAEATQFYQSGCFTNLIKDVVLCEDKFAVVRVRPTMVRVS